MEPNRKGGVLCIKTDGASAELAVEGTLADIFYNWIALTHQVCKYLETSPEHLAAAMPTAIKDYLERDLKYEVRIPDIGGQPHEEN